MSEQQFDPSPAFPSAAPRTTDDYLREREQESKN
jgi:hypothetical protein